MAESIRKKDLKSKKTKTKGKDKGKDKKEKPTYNLHQLQATLFRNQLENRMLIGHGMPYNYSFDKMLAGHIRLADDINRTFEAEPSVNSTDLRNTSLATLREDLANFEMAGKFKAAMKNI